MKHVIKNYFYVFLDILIISLCVFSAYFFRFNGELTDYYFMQCLIYIVSLSVVTMTTMFIFRLHHRIWQYASIQEFISLFKAISISCILANLFTMMIVGEGVPLFIFLLSYQSIFLLSGATRMNWRLLQTFTTGKSPRSNHVLIIGAGDCGTMVARKLQTSEDATMSPIGFIDDDPAKWKKRLCGLPVIGGRECIMESVNKYKIEDIVIALPSIPRNEIIQLIHICKQTNARLKIIPRINDLIHGKFVIDEMRNVEVEDLLGREPVKVDLAGIISYIEGKTVLVTGAGGSIGSELCRQLAPFQPSQLLLLGHGENSIYSIEMELKNLFPELQVQPIIADVRDASRLQELFDTYQPNIVFHAAAHKHVPLMEENPSEAIKNNVLGTKNVADCADQYKADIFVLISTDKAVNPTSVMGATKRIGEMYVQSLGQHSSTKFVAVRFGNVLGSRGSVIPRFKEQIRKGGPITVTHPEMIRYFMTIPEASQLVIQAGALANGGEIFILDMGKPVKILDLAEELIRLSGFKPYTDIPIEFVGTRPGEKMYEELLTNEEGLTSTKHNRIFIGKPSSINRSDLVFAIKKLEKVIGENPGTIRNMLKVIVPTYQNVS
jgi:FlaA1/EpsC-like NDP-sugar epimerase